MSKFSYYLVFLFLILFSIAIFNFLGNTDSDLLKESQALYKKGEISSAILKCDEHLKLYPDNRRELALLIKGKLLEELQKYDEALRQYEEVIKINSKNKKAHFYKAWILYFHKKDYIKAIEEFNSVLKLDQSDIQSAILLGVSYIRVGKYEKGGEVFEKWTELYPENEFLRETYDRIAVILKDVIEEAIGKDKLEKLMQLEDEKLELEKILKRN